MAKPRNIDNFDPDKSLNICLHQVLSVRAGEAFSLQPHNWEHPTRDDIHDYRVAVRRLQSLLKVFRFLFPKKELRDYYKPLRKLIKVLGEIREVDVFIGLIEEGRRLSTTDGKSLALLVAQKLDTREQLLLPAQEHFHDMMQRNFQRRFIRFIQKNYRKQRTPGKKNGVSLQASFRKNAYHILPGLVSTLDRHIANVLGDRDDTDKLHDLRLKAKPLKYTMEIFRPAFGDQFKGYIKEITGMIDLLGTLHDHDVFLDELFSFRRQLELYNKHNEERFVLEPVQSLEARYRTMRREEYRKLMRMLTKWQTERHSEKFIKLFHPKSDK